MFRLSKCVQLFRSRRTSKENLHNSSASQAEQKDPRPPLPDLHLPLVLPAHQNILPNLGWTVITFPPISSSSENSSEYTLPLSGPHPIQAAYETLFAAAQTFFNLPASEKRKWISKNLGTEEGYTRVPGEKEFITLRTLEGCPDVLKESARRYWELLGVYLDSVLARVETGIGLPVSTSDQMHEGETGGLSRYIGRCNTIHEDRNDRTATMLRLFRYEGDEEKIVAEPHSDLGLLSFVVGSVPGLEVWDGFQFLDVERGFQGPAGILLGGRQLEQLTNGRFKAGGHRVVSYGRNSDSSIQSMDQKPADVDLKSPKYRFSIVFVLRTDEDVVVDTDALTTDITGIFQNPVRGITAKEWYEGIRKAHYNINTNLDEREVQRRKVLAMKGGSG